MSEKMEKGEAGENMVEAKNHNIQDPPPYSEHSEEKEHTFSLKDAEASREAELSQRYEKMNFWQRYIIELLMMFFFFSSAVTRVPQTEIFLMKACEINLQYDEAICHDIRNSTNKEYYAAAARITKNMGLLKDIVTTVPGAISAVIAGQYMARYGFKLPLLLSCFGTLASLTGDFYTFYNFSTPLYFNVLTAIPQAFTGGVVIFLTAVFTNVTVTCPSEERKRRFLMIQFFMFLPMVSSITIGPYFYEKFGVLGLAAITYTIAAIPLLILLFVYQDTGVSESARADTLQEAWKHCTSLDTFKQSYSYLTRKRPGRAKTQIVFMICCLMTGVIAFTGTADLDQLYVTGIFGWSNSLYGVIKAVVMAITFIGSIPTMIILTKLKFSDPMLVVIGFGAFALRSSLTSVLFLGYAMYIIPSIVGLPFLVGLTSVRSHLSRLLEQHEVPVVFALTSACEQLVPVLGDIGVTAIYNATNDFFPGLVYLVQGILFLIPMGLAFLCYRWTKIEGYPEYNTLEDETEPDAEP